MPRPRWPSLTAVFWSAHAATWDDGAPPGEIAARTASLVDWVGAHARAGARVLDAGCATGTHTLALAGAGYRVVGIDYSAAMLRRAERKAIAARPSHEGSPTFYEFDLARAELPAELRDFDVVLCFGVLQCVPSAPALLRTLRGALAPDGVLLIEVKDATAPTPAARGHSAPSRVFAPIKRLASAYGARPVTRGALVEALAAAGLRIVEDKSTPGWLRVAAAP